MKQRIYLDTSVIEGKLFMNKKFDAVKFQQKVRIELGEKYLSDRGKFLRELKEKYGDLKRANLLITPDKEKSDKSLIST